MRKPAPLLALFALAAALIFGLDLAWNLHKAPPPLADVAPLAAPETPASAGAPPLAAIPVEQARGIPQQTKREQKPKAKAAVAQTDSGTPPAVAEANEAAATAAIATAEYKPLPEPSPAAPPLSQSEKIDRLISYVANLKGAVFIRNGSEYGPEEAAKHMQLKREKAGDRVKTADDFISLCASKSYLSGKEYHIRLADGRTLTSEQVLREELARLEK